MSVDGVMVANAALAEVGLAQIAVRLGADGVTVKRGVAPSATSDRLGYRAGLLGYIAENGAARLVRCHLCAIGGNRRGTVPCTPARDALRGVTCGREP